MMQMLCVFSLIKFTHQNNTQTGLKNSSEYLFSWRNKKNIDCGIWSIIGGAFKS